MRDHRNRVEGDLAERVRELEATLASDRRFAKAIGGVLAAGLLVYTCGGVDNQAHATDDGSALIIGKSYNNTSSTTYLENVTNSNTVLDVEGAGYAIRGASSGSSGIGIDAQATGSGGYAVYAYSHNTGATRNYGVYAQCDGSNGVGVQGTSAYIGMAAGLTASGSNGYALVADGDSGAESFGISYATGTGIYATGGGTRPAVFGIASGTDPGIHGANLNTSACPASPNFGPCGGPGIRGTGANTYGGVFESGLNAKTWADTNNTVPLAQIRIVPSDVGNSGQYPYSADQGAIWASKAGNLFFCQASGGCSGSTGWKEFAWQ